MTSAATFSSNSHLIMILAAILLAAIMIWKITSQCARKKRHLITGALLVVIVTTLGIGVYPVVFQKNKPSTEAKDGDIEKSGDTIFISKITPMRDENNENRCASQIAHEDSIPALAKRPKPTTAERSKPELRNQPGSGVAPAATVPQHLDPATCFPQTRASQLVILDERTLSAVLAIKSAQNP